MIRLLLAGTILFAWTSASADPVEIKIGYLRGPQPKTIISLIDIPPENNGIAGAQLAINDNNTTGKFLNQRFSLEDVQLNDKDDVAAATSALAARGVSLIIADLPAAALLKAADAAGSRGLLFFNVGALDDRLREEDCRPRSNGCGIRGNGGDAGTVERQLDERNDRNRSENRNHGLSARMVRW